MPTLPTIVLLELEDLGAKLTMVQTELDMCLMRMFQQNKVVCEVLSRLETIKCVVRDVQESDSVSEVEIDRTIAITDDCVSSASKLHLTIPGVEHCFIQGAKCLTETIPSSGPGLLKSKRQNLSKNNSVMGGTTSTNSLSTPSALNKTCVSVILKSSRQMINKAVRLRHVARRLFQVEQLVSPFSLKFGHKTSPGVQMRLDYCFHQPAEVRQFYNSVNNLEPVCASPKLVCSFLISEAGLGYQHRPVLSEQDLLVIQNSGYCKNLFRTCIPIQVVLEGDTVVYNFKTVTDVNKFLFNKSSIQTTRSLGLLRSNVIPKKCVLDEKGFFRLFSADKDISVKLGRRNAKLQIKQPCTGGNYLLFSNKLELFKFLLSDSASNFNHLQFDEERIVNYEEHFLEDKNEALEMTSSGNLESIINDVDEHNKLSEKGVSGHFKDTQLKKVQSGEMKTVELKTVCNIREKEIESFKMKKLDLKDRIFQMKALEKLYHGRWNSREEERKLKLYLSIVED